MNAGSISLLWLLLAIYGAGILWVLVLLYVTMMKFAGVIRIEKPRWLFGTVQRSIVAVLFSASALIAFDAVIRAMGVL